MKFYPQASVFLAYLILIILLFGINFPFFDQWEFTDELDKMYQGDLSIKDLFAQHNEHRIFFPYLIMLGLAYLSHWNIQYELWVNILLGTAIFITILPQLKKSFVNTEFPYPNLIVFAFCLLFFSLAQSENWIWGWQIQIFLNVWMVCGGIILLSSPSITIFRFLLALLAGFVATFSFANGMAYWPIGLLILVFSPLNLKRKISFSILWILVFAGLMFLYLSDYQRPAHHPYPNGISLDFVANYISFVLAYLGAAIFESDGNAAFIFGIVGLGIYLFGIVKIYLNKEVNYKNYLVYLYLSFYALASALVTGLGRTGVAQAASSRYLTISNLFWLANFVILFTLFQSSFHFTNKQKNLLMALILILLLGMFSSHIVGTKDASEHYYLMKTIRDEIEKPNPDTLLLRDTYPNIKILLERKEVLKKNKLTFYNSQQ